MKKKTDGKHLLSISVPGQDHLLELITKNRNLYISYNISRLRELIRYLSSEKLDLFNTIPLMLHLNYPDFPGYVAGDTHVHGIVNFHGSGFYTQALAINQLSEAAIQPYTTEFPVIISLFHIGSAGTLTQSEKSDFDYWVIVDKKIIDDKRLSLLQEKLSQIEAYCHERFRQEVTFFVHDAVHIRNNDFATVDVSSYGLAPKSVLKEEFYRTFIMIAGKTPYWAILPSNLTDPEYRAYVDTIGSSPHLKEMDNDYIDLGNLDEIDIRECLGVILWQIFKAKDDPVKSLVKASLIASYYFFQGRDHPLLCNSIKNHFHEALLDNYHLDPYALVFETIYKFYQSMMDSPGVELIKTCIFLRLCGFPFVSLPGEESPKRFLLKRYVREWGMDKETVTRLVSYIKWPEADKQAFDDEIFRKLSFLYELILRNQDEKLIGIDMSAFNLSILKNRTAAFLTKKPGKISRCSTWLEKMRGRLKFLLTDRGHDNAAGWHIYGGTKTIPRSSGALLFRERDFLKAAGWIVANHLYSETRDNVCFESSEKGFFKENKAIWFKELITFMTEGDSSDESPFLYDPTWQTLYMQLKPGSEIGQGLASGLDMFVKNSWGEYFFDTVDLSYIGNESEKCNKIAAVIWVYMVKSPAFTLKYKLSVMGDSEPSGTEKTVSEIIQLFIEAEKKKSEKTEIDDLTKILETPITEPRPYLDMI